MIVRVIVLIAVILAVLYVIDAYKQLQSGRARGGALGGDARGPSSANRPSADRPSGDRLVECASCGVHIPAAKALWDDDRQQAFCSPACRRLERPS